MKIRLFACYPCHTIFLLTNVTINMRWVTPFPSTVLFHALFGVFLKYFSFFLFRNDSVVLTRFLVTEVISARKEYTKSLYRKLYLTELML